MCKGARRTVWGWLVLAVLLAGCGRDQPASLADFFPGTDAVQGWTPDEVQVFDSETIFNLVNGQADFFFAYGFEQVAVRNYENAAGAVLMVEVWQLATPADAYGLFMAGVAGSPVDVGNDGDADPGRRLAFWQDRYAVQVRARRELPDADLRSLAELIAKALPSGGERPALMERLPADGLVERGAMFFHEELSIQNEIWLGGENLLGLSQETDGVLARYDLGGGAAQLLLLQYPQAAEAAAGLAALENSQVDGLVAAEARGNLLGAVFGDVDTAAAGELVAEAVGK